MSEGEIGNACPGRWAPCGEKGRTEQRVVGEHESVELTTPAKFMLGATPGGLHVCKHCGAVYWVGA